MKCRLLTKLFFFILISVSSNTMGEGVLRFNPFKQPDMESEKTANSIKVGNELKLRGTVVDGADSIANISGTFYRINQEIAGYRVIRIESGKVTLHRGVNETVLTLNNDDKSLR